MARRGTLPLVVLSVSAVVLMAAAGPLAALSHQSVSGALIQIPYLAPFSLVGFVIARRQPRNLIGWIMLAIAPVYLLGGDAGGYAVYAFRLGHPDVPLGRLAVSLTQTWFILPLLLPVPILLFPDGKLPADRWRWTVRAYVLAGGLLLVGVGAKDVTAFTAKHVKVDQYGELVSISHSNSNGLVKAFPVVLFLTCLICGLSWVVRQLLIFRHASGERRQQLKWLMAGAALGILGFTLSIVTSNSHSLPLQVVGDAATFAVDAVPITMGIAILRYRLYDIDRVISRTLSYAVLTGLLVGFYIGIVALATRALPLSSPVAVALSTLAVATLFAPIRRRVQRSVDRRFNRAKYDAQAMVTRFSTGLRDAVDLDVVQSQLVDTVNHAVEPSTVSVWLARA
jgi:hypothetical protein